MNTFLSKIEALLEKSSGQAVTVDANTWETCSEIIAGHTHKSRKEQLVAWAEAKGFYCYLDHPNSRYVLVKYPKK